MPAFVLSLNAQNVGARSVDDLTPHMEWNVRYVEYMNASPGLEHYKMLAEISHQLPSGARVVDVGTFYGASALALSSNADVHVTTYDIAQFIPTDGSVKTALTRPNVNMKLLPGHEDIETIARAQFVLLDIDPHDGPEETRFVQQLIDNGFRGILACDDIKLNQGMHTFWNSIPSSLKKVDVSHIAHWSGTGLVVFDPTYADVIVQ